MSKMSKSNPFLPRQSSNFNHKKQMMKTPHPKIYKQEEADAQVSSYLDINTTKDKTFIGKNSAFTYDETERTERTGKYRNIFSKNNSQQRLQRLQRFSVPPKLSDYFINFDKIKRKFLSRSSDSRQIINRSSHSPILILNDSRVNSDSKTVTRSLSSQISHSISNVYSNSQETQSMQSIQSIQSIAKQNPPNFSTYGTPMFGQCNFGNSSEKKEKETLHPKLPLSKKNDEIFKSRLISKLRGDKMSTDTHKFTINRKRKLNEINYSTNFDYTLFKRRKSSSCKKIYYSDLPLLEGSDFKYFQFYRDSDIGITSPWRASLIPQTIDNDTDTDDETMHNAIYECIYSIKSAIEEFHNKDGQCLANKMTLINRNTDDI